MIYKGIAFLMAAGSIFLMGQECGCDQDMDDDGWTNCDGDCDDNNSEVFPGATEQCDSLDNDCDGEIDEGLSCGNYDDFSDLDIGSDLPDGWELTWDDGGQMASYGIGGTTGDAAMYVQSPESPYYRLAIKNAAVDAEDIEVLFLTSNNQYYDFAIRAQGDSFEGHSAYLIESWLGTIYIVKIVDSYDSYGGQTTLTDGYCTEECSGTHTGNHWVRFRAEGRTLKARLWSEESDEPGDWQLEVTDTSITGAGWFGPVTYTNYANSIQKVAWATGGGSASFDE